MEKAHLIAASEKKPVHHGDTETQRKSNVNRGNNPLSCMLAAPGNNPCLKSLAEAELAVEIVRFVEDHQPPILACEFVDAAGQRHTVVDKAPIFGGDWCIDPMSPYPQPGSIRCQVLARWRDAHGQELARINTAEPDHIESIEGLSEFVVLASRLSPV